LNGATGDAGSVQTAAPLPRTFILIFNLSDYHQDLTPILDYFFEKVIRPKDRILAISNFHFFPEWEVTSPEITKAQILKVIDKEVKRMRANITRFEVELRVAAATFKSDIAFAQLSGAPVSPIFQEFFRTHRFVMEDMKRQFLSLPVEGYIETAEYLKSRSGDKYVFNFFQVGHLPMLDTFGEIQRIVNGYME
ncbi:MAG: hypothetical protein GY940_11755, partial [bacterium]|nr:hypothetical protein [bacterium]